MNKKIAIILASLISILSPSVILAAPTIPAPGLPALFVGVSIWGIISGVLTVIWQVFIGGAIIMFIIAGFEFFTANGEAGKLQTARMNVVWGCVGMAIALLAFSLPYIIGAALFSFVVP